MRKIIQTERLILKEFSVDEAESFFQLNDNPLVMQYTGDEPFASISEAQQFIANYNHYSIHGFGRWSVVRKTDEQFIGWCGLKRNEREEVDLGFRFFQEEWNKGYATECSFACLDYGFSFLGLRRIIGRAHKDNLASIRVLEKIGMKYFNSNNEWRHFEIMKN